MTNTPEAKPASDRRPIKARSARWAAWMANALVRWNVSPNTVSVGSVVFALVGAAALVATRWTCWCGWLSAGLYLLAVLGIQGRLICNLLDGMVAVEGGKGGPLGGIYNDLPDRLADPLLIAAAGYAAMLPGAIELGWLAAAGSLLTAYVRVLGKSLGAQTYFTGPMAKQHRMALLTAACLLSAVLGFVGLAGWPMVGALALIAVGCVVTCARRLSRIRVDLLAAAEKSSGANS
jgi:phosphatidylglycerophosphate synthase